MLCCVLRCFVLCCCGFVIYVRWFCALCPRWVELCRCLFALCCDVFLFLLSCGVLCGEMRCGVLLLFCVDMRVVVFCYVVLC